jgi:hypothetical protein
VSWLSGAFDVVRRAAYDSQERQRDRRISAVMDKPARKPSGPPPLGKPFDVVTTELARLATECCKCLSCGHIQAEPNWCHVCGHRTEMPGWARELVGEHQRYREAIADALADLTPGIVPYSVLEAALCPSPPLTEERGS